MRGNVASIDEVIARSRRGGGFSTRKRFTLARSSAIRKMREFALADPSYYVLELIQAAVANGATAINIDLSEKDVLFSWVGGVIRKEEMASLFDFLFASKDRLEVGHLRELALGINALLLFAPETIILESGDGTEGNTHRMVVLGKQDAVEVGESDETLNGTFLRAIKIDRGQARRRGFHGFSEPDAIESRCLAAPVPIIVNDEAPFGYASVRVPFLFGYSRVQSFDEGDLYGTVARCQSEEPTARLLTYGVWVQSIQTEPVRGVSFEGIINFDRLRKTADHAGIVRDEVFGEMGVRLRPYILKLGSGKAPLTLHDVAVLDGPKIEPHRLRTFLQDAERVVVAPPEAKQNADLRRRALAVADALDAPVLICPEREIPSLRLIGGSGVHVVAPDLRSDFELHFYRGPLAVPPPRPWLTGPVEVPKIPLADLVEALGEQPGSTGSTTTKRLLVGVGDVTAMLHASSETARGENGVWARVVTTGRVAWEGELPSAYPGQWLTVEVPDLSPSLLRREVKSDGVPLAELIAGEMLSRARSAQALLNRRALAALFRGVEEGIGDAARNVALQELTRRAVVRLRQRRPESSRPGVSLTLLESEALLELPVFRSLAGGDLTPRQLVTNLDHTHGLVYGAIPEVPADVRGLDTSSILSLDAKSERLIVMLVGEAAYVRVDGRDLLAEQDGVLVRDVAVGLQPYPDFPLLVEGVDPSAWEPQRQYDCLRALLHQLRQCFLGVEPRQPEDPAAFGGWEENRRQACRHLQWFVCREMRRPGAELFGIDELPLFIDDSGGVCTAVQVDQVIRDPDRDTLVLQYGTAFAHERLGELAAAAAFGQEPRGAPPSALAVSPFLHRLLSAMGEVRLGCDFDLTSRDARDNPTTPETAFIVEADVEGSGFNGRLGVPADEGAQRAVILLDRSGRLLRRLCDLAEEYGVSGFVRLHRAQSANELEAALDAALERAIEALLSELTRRLAAGKVREEWRVRVETLLLDFAGKHLVLSATPVGTVLPSIIRPVAQAVSSLPLFPLGDDHLASAWQLATEFCSFGVAAFDEERNSALARVVRGEMPEHLAAWVRDHLNEGRVARPSSAPRSSHGFPSKMPAPEPGKRGRLINNLVHWLEALRPDEHLTNARPVRIRLVPALSEVANPELAISPSEAVHIPSLAMSARAQMTHLHWEVEEAEFARYQETSSGRLVLDATLFLCDSHWLVEACLGTMPDPEPLAWLLLAAYAHINEILEPVTNEHECAFQLRVLEALVGGELRYVEA